MRRSLFALLLAAAAVGCGDSFDPAAEGRLRFVHASPDAPNVDILIDGDREVSDLEYTESSDYINVDAGSRAVRVEPVNSNDAVISASLPVVAGTDYTILAANLVASIEPIVLTDNNTAPAAGNIKLRLVHGAPSAPDVDIYITAPNANIDNATPQLANVPFGAASAYLEVPAGTYQVRITLAGTKTVAIDSGALTLQAGQIRTAIARDNDGSGAPFGVILLEDRN